MKIYAYPSPTRAVRFIAAKSLQSAKRAVQHVTDEVRVATIEEISAAYADACMLPLAGSHRHYAASADFVGTDRVSP